MPESGVRHLSHGEIISYESILRLVSILARHGVSKVRITGGEPLARKGLEGFINSLCGIEGISDVSMTTNGTLLESHASSLYAAGLKRINISLDSLLPERFKKITRIGSLDDVVSGIESAKNAGFNPIKINTVLIKGINDDEILKFVEFARRHDLNLRFIEYMPVGVNLGGTVSSKETAEIIKSEYPDFARVQPEGPILEKNDFRSKSVSNEFSFKDGRGFIGFISPISDHFCGNCDRIRLTPSGNLRPCLFYDDEYDIKGILKDNDDEAVFRKILEITQRKSFRHSFEEKSKFGNSYMWANDFMSGIGG